MACLPMPERLPLQPLLSALKHPEVLVSYSGAQWDQLMRLARAGDLVSRVAALARQLASTSQEAHE